MSNSRRIGEKPRTVDLKIGRYFEDELAGSGSDFLEFTAQELAQKIDLGLTASMLGHHLTRNAQSGRIVWGSCVRIEIAIPRRGERSNVYQVRMVSK